MNTCFKDQVEGVLRMGIASYSYNNVDSRISFGLKQLFARQRFRSDDVVVFIIQSIHQ